MYAILDIETTGGKLTEQGITEVAIYRFDGNEVIDQLISLVNPLIPVDAYVTRLTGISDSMLHSAPKFFEIAKRIIEITDGCTLVAHNADFDYRILRIEFDRLGYDFRINTLCTVELSRKLLPDHPSYSLGKLVASLGIPITERHRASGDAIATLKLFQLLLSKDLKKEYVQMLVKSKLDSEISPKIITIIEELPSKTGVFYIHKADGTIIYIGRDKSIKKGVSMLFARTSRKAKKVQKETSAVTFEETGGELIAQLKEIEELNNNQPKYNKPKRNEEIKWGIFRVEDGSLLLMKSNNVDGSIIYFESLGEAKNILRKYLSIYNLHIEIARDFSVRKHYLTSIGRITEIAPTKPNDKETLEAFIKEISLSEMSFILINKGRNINEHSAVLIENGIYKGFAFYDLNYQITNSAILKNILTPMQNTKEALNIIQIHYLKRADFCKIIRL